jgi:hypothetical protein
MKEQAKNVNICFEKIRRGVNGISMIYTKRNTYWLKYLFCVCTRNETQLLASDEGQLCIHSDDLDPDLTHQFQEEDFDDDFNNIIKAII